MIAAVDVLKSQSRFREKLAQRHCRPLAGERTQFTHFLGPPARQRIPDTLEHALRRHTVELHAAPGRQERESLLHLFADVKPTPAEQRLEAPIVTELLSVLPDKVQHRTRRLFRRLSQSSPQLLKKEQRTLRRPEHQQRVHLRDIDPLIEQVY